MTWKKRMRMMAKLSRHTEATVWAAIVLFIILGFALGELLMRVIK